MAGVGGEDLPSNQEHLKQCQGKEECNVWALSEPLPNPKDYTKSGEKESVEI